MATTVNAEGGEPPSSAEEVARRRQEVEQLVAAGAKLGWVAAAGGQDRPPRPTIDWNEQGRAILSHDLASDEGWQMAKARLAVRIEDAYRSGEDPAEIQRRYEHLASTMKKARRDADARKLL